MGRKSIQNIHVARNSRLLDRGICKKEDLVPHLIIKANFMITMMMRMIIVTERVFIRITTKVFTINNIKGIPENNVSDDQLLLIQSTAVNLFNIHTLIKPHETNYIYVCGGGGENISRCWTMVLGDGLIDD